jgi:hypothetical protein
MAALPTWPAKLKLKPKLTRELRGAGGSADRIAWGDWGEAVMLELADKNPRPGKRREIRQAVRIGRSAVV